MFEDYNICPYTGLRSFTEEESIYFKGRDEHIQEATKQLEQNKFLMVTGASGDGKSSIVFAGIIPNARAGFLKSQYPNWQIADFRPERTPFENLCDSLAKALNIPSQSTVEAELQHGFSALIDLYKSSDLYIDQDSAEFQGLAEEEKTNLQRRSANLMILVDQFEEFFTNPENYVNGAPSESATLTMNLLLESAKLAREEGYPIYIVFTMRSDFIGQCAAFRELPEYIGFSQFFVPRLNRKLFQEVIEEPCALSGNSITRRLTERIIHDMGDGVDQLPVLQHALNQIWKAADNGKEEMDLIHYAMVGGLEPGELETADQERFHQWFNALPANIQACYGERSLYNVLDTHANKLYENATSYVKEKTGKDISPELINSITKTVFTSLTKIDQSREVRNRMTLADIRDILNEPEADLEIMSVVIDQFREPGNTFVRPFILENNDNKLEADSVLDITHESLIRNWQKLKEWTTEEYEKFVVFKDFKQQVDRWLEHGRSIGFLLPIGSLTFFESWYTQAKINKSWVNRYNEQVTDTPKNIEESAKIVRDSKSFLLQSAQKHLITRAVIRFGPKRIGFFLGALIILGLSSFYFYDYRKRTNAYVYDQILDASDELINAKKATVQLKADNLIFRERTTPGTLWQNLDAIEDDNNRLVVAIGVADNLITNDRRGNLPIKKEVLLKTAELAGFLYAAELERSEVSAALTNLLNAMEAFEYFNYFYDDAKISAALQATGQLLISNVFHAINEPHADLEVLRLNEAIEMGLNHQLFTTEEIKQVIAALNSQDKAINSFYSKDKIIGMGRASESLTHNGKFHILADLHAALGDADAALMAIDSLLVYQPRYSDYTTDGTSVAGIFARYGHWPALDVFARGYGQRLGYKKYEIYRQMANRSGVLTQSVNDRFSYAVAGTSNLWYNVVLDFMPEEALNRLYVEYRRAFEEEGLSSDEKNFNLAIYYKQKGLFYAKRFTDKQIPQEKWLLEVELNYKEAIDHFRSVSATYLNEVVRSFFHLPADMPRRQIFIFPDYIESVPSHAPRTRYSNYLSNTFINYIIEEELLTELYRDGSELRQTAIWLREYKNSISPILFVYEGNQMSTEELIEIYNGLLEHPNSSFVNFSLYLVDISHGLFKIGLAAEAIEYALKIIPQQIQDLYNEEWPIPHMKTMGLIGELSTYLALNDQLELSFELIKAHPDIRNQTRLLDRVAQNAFIADNYEIGNLFFDSASYNIENYNEINMDNRVLHAYAMALKGNVADLAKVRDLAKNADGFPKLIASNLNPRATALRGHYFEIISSIPKYASSDERLRTYNQIIYSKVYYSKQSEWQTFDSRHEYIYLTTGFN